ncbi:MAG: YfhO family protein [Anaerolineae bacterium]|nr:YfhO family protein [Anaerolineae bacterium]
MPDCRSDDAGYYRLYAINHHLQVINMKLPRISFSKSDWLALGLITLAVLVFYAPVWLLGKWMPSGGGDLVSFIWPTYTFAGRMLRSGQLPLWNPHLYSGAPFWADNQSGVLYPPNWLLFALPDFPYQAMEAMVIAHIWFTGVAMYACLRLAFSSSERSISSPAAALGAIAWMFSDVFVTHQGHYNLIAVAAWLPLVFFGVWRGLRDLDWRWALVGGAAFGIGTLAGHGQITYYTALMIGVIGLWWISVRVFTRLPSSQGFASQASKGKSLLRTVGLIMLIILIGLGLSAGGWLPALEMTGYTARAELVYEEASKFSLAPRGLIGLVAPWVYGRGPFRFKGDFDRVAVGYIGVTALVLAIYGTVQGLRVRRRRWVIFLTILWVVAFLAALGKYFPLHRLLYDIVPGFQSFRAPARLILPANMAWAMLAAWGLEAIPWERLKGSITANHVPGLPWLAGVMVAAELIGFGAQVEIQDSNPGAGYDTYAGAAAWLAEQPDEPFRVDTYFPPEAGWQQPDFAVLYGGSLYDIYGIFNPLTIATYQTYYLSLGWRGSAPYNFLGVQYVITDGEAPGDATFVPAHQTNEGLAIYENSQALPMALVVHKVVVVEEQSQAWELVHAADWDARAVAYIEGGSPLEGQTPKGKETLTYTRYEANRIDLKVSTDTPAYLVLSEVYYPGWKATIDGQAVPIYRANSAFRAIYIDQAGEHDVSLVFRPITVYAGLAISIVTALATIGMARRSRKRG